MDFEQNIQPEVIPVRPGQKCVYCSELAPSVMCNPTLIQPIRGKYTVRLTNQKTVFWSEVRGIVQSWRPA